MTVVRAGGKLRAFLALTAILCLCAAVPVAAQLQRGQLRLEVRDPAGAGVAARGEVLSQGNDFQRSFQVASDGNYLLQDLPFGVYRLSVHAEGFAAWSDVVEVHSSCWALLRSLPKFRSTMKRRWWTPPRRARCFPSGANLSRKISALNLGGIFWT